MVEWMWKCVVSAVVAGLVVASLQSVVGRDDMFWTLFLWTFLAVAAYSILAHFMSETKLRNAVQGVKDGCDKKARGEMQRVLDDVQKLCHENEQLKASVASAVSTIEESNRRYERLEDENKKHIVLARRLQEIAKRQNAAIKGLNPSFTEELPEEI